jgi:hypothetical protein
MLDTELKDLVIVSEPSGRQLIGPKSDVLLTGDGLMVLKNPLMFMEQKGQDPQSGKFQVQPLMMPILLSEFVDEITLIPASWIILPAQCSIATQYRAQWDEYESTVRAQSAGIVMARSMPKGPVVAAPNGRL